MAKYHAHGAGGHALAVFIASTAAGPFCKRSLPARPGPRALRGFTLLEILMVMVISGLLLQAVISGQNLIQSARLQSLSAQQDAVASAILLFHDRYRALPGDYRNTDGSVPCDAVACPGGDGNGYIDADATLAKNEDILAWTQLSGAGFLNAFLRIETPATPAASLRNSPQNAFGGFFQFAHDARFGPSSNTTRRLNVKTGNRVPVELLAVLDSRVDDGRPGSGRFQFSRYAGDGDAPPVSGDTGCLTADAADADWAVNKTQSNCGAAFLIRF